VVRRIYKMTDGNLPIIGVGGIFGPDDAREKLDAGAVLVQVFTGLIYQGPGLVRAILEGLHRT
jgi:dihydroorotate dehydrogenase